MKKTAILIDAGGVILDETALEQLCCDFTVQVLRKTDTEYSPKQYWLDIDDAVKVFAPRTRPYVLWKYCGNDRGIYDGFIQQLYKEQEKQSRTLTLMPGIGAELKKLSGRFELILAGQYRANIYDLLKQHGLDDLFKNRLSQDDFKITKPDPRYLAKIATVSGVDPEECIMIGDRIDNDVVPARQCGMGTVFVKTGIYKKQLPRDPQEIPDIILDSVVGLADAILGLW